MDWKQLIVDMRAQGETYASIGLATGMSKGQVHDLSTSAKRTVLYETGVRLVELHKRTTRRRRVGR